jgi:hypothetical protein
LGKGATLYEGEALREGAVYCRLSATCERVCLSMEAP